ncbi:carbohydate-binding domain-containing protein [Photobacterium frigidiphilum]|uniref:family 20 glycosylhydrolase n=1 Tax=Photobacterium frigidiphilum TaxID=264736 RepID=UPI003D1345BE
MFRKSWLAIALATTFAAPALAITPQDLNAIGDGLNLKYRVIDNTEDTWVTHRGSISFTNNSAKILPAEDWAIYFSHIRMLKSLSTPDLTFTHVNGDMFKIEPTSSFKPLKPGETFSFEFNAGDWQVAKSDVMPNWYLASEHNGELISALIKSTSNRINGVVPTSPDKELPFVAEFDTPEQWKRYDSSALTDAYDPFTAQDRYERNADLSIISDAVGVVPSPTSIDVGEGSVTIDPTWVVVYDNGYSEQAHYLAEQLGITATTWSPSLSKVIKMGWGQVGGQTYVAEAYKLDVDSTAEKITIKAVDQAGAFYASQSLLQLQQGDVIPEVAMSDSPRFAYRGLSVDSSRNFRSKDSMLQLLDQMAEVKLNKLHFRLSDDEGWRIEIPELPELTDVGSNRCHDLVGDKCIMPFLGAGNEGTTESSGFYTVDDYREILRHAKSLNIEVIPEIDMPGHAHAAIKSMEARYNKLIEQGQEAKATEYLLTDFSDKTEYLSVQMFKDNAINVCMESTYSFVDKVVSNLVSLHSDIQPLKTFHFGGDEVAGAWTDSPVCKAFIDNNTAGVNSSADLGRYFVTRTSAITANYNLNLGGWEDGLLDGNTTFPRGEFVNDLVVGNAWQNIWEWGVADRAYNLANNGYGVILNQATHLYFDHPYEPDPSERGYYWAPRFTDTRKTFSFMPDDVFGNADFTRAGAPITKEEVVASANVKSLERPENILGLQGSLWAETVRTEEQFEGMVFPRMLGLAERAWHTAAWEADDLADKPADKAGRVADYNRFANLVGQNLLPRMEADGIAFNLPVPGAVIENGILKANSPFPGLGIEFSGDNGVTWQGFNVNNPPTAQVGVQVRTVSGERTSRVATVK